MLYCLHYNLQFLNGILKRSESNQDFLASTDTEGVCVSVSLCLSFANFVNIKVNVGTSIEQGIQGARMCCGRGEIMGALPYHDLHKFMYI